MRILSVLALLVVACGDDDSGNGKPLTVDELESAYRSAACRYLVACGQFPDRATCLSANLPYLSDRYSFDLDPNLIAAIKAGHVQLDSVRVSTCLAAIAANSCDMTDRDGRDIPRQCMNYLHGTVPAYGGCFLNEECISQQCSGGTTDGVCQTGICVGDTPPPTEPAALGMPCSFRPGCVDGAFCDDNDTFTCLALRRAGEPCFLYEDCDYGLACLGDASGRSCKALPVLGESCPDRQCRDDGTYCAPNGTCEAIGLPPATCNTFTPCASPYPCDVSSGTCVRGPALGEPCSQGTSIRCFDFGTICDSTINTCIAPKPDGQPCTIDGVCASKHCDLSIGECAPALLCL